MMRLYCLTKQLEKAFVTTGKQLHRIILTWMSLLSNAIFISSLNTLMPIKILFVNAPDARVILSQGMH